MSRHAHPAGTRRPPDRRPTTANPEHLAVLLVRAWEEVRSGRRPFGQIAPLLSPVMRRRFGADLATARRGPEAPPLRVRRAVTCAPVDGVCEVSIVIERDGRVTAVAVRLERHRGGWRVVEFTAPESGIAPLHTASLAAEPRDAFDEVLDEAGGTEEAPSAPRPASDYGLDGDGDGPGTVAPVIPLRPRGNA